MNLNFTCPKCGGHKIEEVMNGVTVTSVILSVDEHGDMEYGDCTNEGGAIEQYQCADCGQVVLDEGWEILDPIALAKFLAK